VLLIELRALWSGLGECAPGCATGAEGLNRQRSCSKPNPFADYSSLFFSQFASFEKFVEMIYARLPKPKSECNKVEQLGVSAAAGYAAGFVTPLTIMISPQHC